jgi:hypothetical protein
MAVAKYGVQWWVDEEYSHLGAFLTPSEYPGIVCSGYFVGKEDGIWVFFLWIFALLSAWFI